MGGLPLFLTHLLCKVRQLHFPFCVVHFLLFQLRFSAHGPLLKNFLCAPKLYQLLFAVGKLVFKFCLAVHKFLNGVVLANCQAAALLHNFVQVTNLAFEILNQFTGLSFLVLGSFD